MVTKQHNINGGYNTQVAGHGSRFTGHRSRVTGHRSRVAGHGSRVTGHRWRVTGCGSQVAGYGSQIAGHGSQVYFFRFVGFFRDPEIFTLLAKLYIQTSLAYMLSIHTNITKVDFDKLSDTGYWISVVHIFICCFTYHLHTA